VNRRRPLLALCAGLMLPGLGQIYCGEIPRGVAFLLSLGLILPAAAWVGLHAPHGLLAPSILLGVLAALAVYVSSIVAAVRSARRLGDTFAPSPWNRGLVYLSLVILGHLFVLGPLSSYARERLVETFKVPSRSMLPAIVPGDRIFCDKRVGHPGGRKLHRGDIAVFIYQNDRTTMYIKRIIGLPGDKIDIVGTQIKVNGVALEQGEVFHFGRPSLDRLLDQHRAVRESIDGRSYIVLWNRRFADVDSPARQSLSVVVPNGQVFVLGDNRDNSHDSRHFGTLPLADVTAVARQVWFSTSSEHGTLWWRAGLSIQ
jgi:signal peptidase I